MKKKYLLAFMDMAERFAQTSEAVRLKVCALFVREGRILSIGINGQPEGWPTEACEDACGNTLPTVRHAEDAGLQKFVNSTEVAAGCSVFITHSPCLACAIKLVTAKVDCVYYRYQYRNIEGIDYLKRNGIPVECIPANKEVL